MSRTASRIRFAEDRRNHRGDPAKGNPAETSTEEGQRRGFRILLAEFWNLLRGHRFDVSVALLTLTIATLMNLTPPVATKLVIDYVLSEQVIPAQWNWLPLPPDRFQRLLWITGSVAVVTIVATLIHLWGRWHATRAVNRMQVAVRRRVFEHAVRLPLDHVYRIRSGGAASLLREDAGGVADLIFSMLYNPWRAIIQLVGSLIVLMLVDWRLMLGGLLLVPLVFVTHRTWIDRIRPLFRAVRAQRQEVDSHATESFGGMRVVRTFAREKSETHRFVLGNHLLVRKQLYVWWWSRILEVIWEVVIPLASTLLLLYGGYQVLNGDLTLGDLMMFLVYLTMLLSPLATLVTSATTFQNNLAGLDRILDLMEQPQESGHNPDLEPIDRNEVQGQIALRGVSFRYPETESFVLEDIDLTVTPGETIALVGRSGAGKTTLCNLVARFYEPTTGRLELDGKDVSEVNVESYRRLLGIVEQDVFLFDGTIAENIGYAVRNASPQAIAEAAKLAYADEFIDRLEDGYDTIVGERGVRLSGGQRQRLAIARAILADPRILILDEATSNLDTESERLIQKSLRALLTGRTCFIIAHRLSTVTKADRIVVLEAGRIVEVGRHEELLARSGRYRQMVQLQVGEDESGEPDSLAVGG